MIAQVGAFLDSAESYLRELDSGARSDRPSAGDGSACREALGRLMKDAEWTRKVMSGDPAANALRLKLNSFIALANEHDGQPASPEVIQALIKLGLR
jgi:hypothetical protein